MQKERKEEIQYRHPAKKLNRKSCQLQIRDRPVSVFRTSESLHPFKQHPSVMEDELLLFARNSFAVCLLLVRPTYSLSDKDNFSELRKGEA